MNRNTEREASIRRMKESIDFYYNIRRYKSCEKMCLEMLAIEPMDSWTRHILALVYMNTDRHEEAIEIGHSIVKNGDIFQGYYVLATAYEDWGKPAKALEYCKKALEVDTKSSNIWCTLLRSHTALKDVQACRELISEMLSRFPLEPPVLYTCFLTANEIETDTVWENELFKHMHPLLIAYPDRLYYVSGKLAQKEGRIQEAYQFYCKSYLENMEDNFMREEILEMEKEYPELKNRKGEGGV